MSLDDFTVVGTEDVMFDYKPREYSVVSGTDIKGRPRFFVDYNDGKPIISDEVPSEYRALMVFGELVLAEKLADSRGTRRDSLQAELICVPEQRLRDYVKFRLETYRELLIHLARIGNGNGEIEKARECYNFLHDLNENYAIEPNGVSDTRVRSLVDSNELVD